MTRSLSNGSAKSNGISRFGPSTTPDGQSIDEAVLQLDEPTEYRRTLDPTLCFQHAAKYPFAWRSMPQEGRLLAAMTAWVQFESHQRAAPDDCDVMDVLRLAWNDHACRDYLHGQLRNTREIDSFAARMACAPAETFIDPSLSPDNIESRALTWLIGGFLAKGVVTGLVGLPGAGKSTFARRVVAALTRGLALPSLLPEGLQSPRALGPTGVLWWGGEEAADSMVKPGLEAVQADSRYWRFLPGAATDTRLDEAGIEKVFRVCRHHDYGLIVIDTLEDLQPDNANLNDGASARRILRPLMLRCQETGVAALVLRHEGKSIRRNGVHVGAGSIQLIAALRATFLLVQCQDDDYQFLPKRQLVPAKVNISCPRSISLSLENVTRVLPDFDGEPVEQLIPVANLGDLGNLTADDIIQGGNESSASEMGTPEKLLEEWLQDGPVRKRDLVKSAKEVGFTERTLRRAADTLGVVRSFLDQENTPRRYWPIVWSLPDMSHDD